MIKAIIVDDEPLAHQVILHHLESYSDIKVVSQHFSAKDALYQLAKSTIDVVFLDINMPELSGLELIQSLANPPQIIIVSAYEEYALAGYELNVTDYLLKPVSAQRLQQAINKVRERISQTPKSKTITLKVDREKRKLSLDTIEYIEAYGNYVKVHQEDQTILATTTLKQILEQLLSSFTQIHKSYIVNNSRVIAVTNEHVELDTGDKIKIGKSFKEHSKVLL
ncbi:MULTISPECIES: response regulator transcription factor [unclassified Pseudoalteromonas]|uniref:LytR/AlgR family response regulator transcription factor n=1 Tax=unclassified Pseudoalteromonas TaxID=194690 RepID=UPI00110AC7E3|nr:MULTISPECIES: response regulator transcription factor [unclassified Pseudoalteromonas]TMP43311.1 DNA-binding response regulator [Pseudoalteromonas sp. S1650]TMP69007.1 DNA-binding response regulator [Pseudoalteromonas sp. S1649]